MITGEIARNFSMENWIIAKYEATSDGVLTRVQVWVMDIDEFHDVDPRRFQSAGSKLLLLIQRDLREKLDRSSVSFHDEMREEPA
jgi:hypothetical protein